ncbi:GNAT family N-acetyltransferase [Lapillicoccus jejuensis]|uniref:Acetyltransferase (GNAT) family protein n=1 Tax=Lapillicoccus jejuensis TaxID=402171 RepID=A0A542DV84_9MICO|nr:GNAT family N-acetyltransferase [Lapillicoccus jejuensis]TQJ07009.1 acetyltransferase (GNAT) family protein [Lapillicoccus jejuensis]
MPTPEPRLRPASTDDLAALTDVFLGCWHVNYARVMPAELVSAMTADRATALMAALLERSAEGRAQVLVAEDPARDDTPDLPLGFVGFTLATQNLGDVASLYVAPTAQGRGVGRRLLAAAEEALRTEGAERSQLWVFAENLPSRQFYAAQGYEPDGRATTLPEWGRPQLGLVKHLGTTRTTTGE